MFEAYLVPTDYEQPRPIDGKYPALVYETYAEFEYAGYKVIADMSHQGAMNANGNTGFVTVHGESVDIAWNGSANSLSEHKQKNERVISYEKHLVATLTPLEFEQPHPFADENHSHGYRGKVIGNCAEFGVFDKYSSVIDGNIEASALAAPCNILPMKGDRTKCIIEFDDATIFMVKRYGPGTYQTLVEKTVNELQEFLRNANAG
ncbi:hypothetical protein ACRZER_002209 [Raoultella ornithinolytica]|uniref:hypothetical protein n=1 Tax=Klebsiella/Raoultella group TaxID=2890311 RepID=UPI0015A7371E|nr:hypothetical protein [Klebsiella variicola]ELS5399711.1 hypothetical protein [Raoultella ornithinolytica]ELS5457687.1 hypothetical protein [Raoultella ornithinolytica]ELS5482183.1 hypothetical protein [Raoultella ornithinolytica]MDV1390323.1 hypothetical protein [Raoultella ornithinolytica]HCL6052111.1 hypothetical protein [Raoultella ornithinolytica]